MTAAILRQQEQLADSVRDNIQAQQDAARFLERFRDNCGDGDELLVAVESLTLRSPAYRRGWLRLVQKRCVEVRNG